MRVSYEQFLNRLAEKTVDNSRQLRRGVQQRRNGMEDLYGVEFTHNGDANHPATFYISISPDLVYYERFAFKFVIGAYESSVSGVSLGEATIGETELTLSGGDINIVDGQPVLDTESLIITPNPHTHTATFSTSDASYGIKRISTASQNWQVRIHGVDITPYLIEQHDGDWIEGEGIYPTNRVVNREDFYDILDVACMLNAEGETDKVEKLLSPEFKKVEIISDAPFSVTAFLYLKYSHSNR